ncbi:hypothetical protein IHEIED_00022 [Methylorubrum populi]
MPIMPRQPRRARSRGKLTPHRLESLLGGGEIGQGIGDGRHERCLIIAPVRGSVRFSDHTRFCSPSIHRGQ